jgi:hypothetical protein
MLVALQNAIVNLLKSSLPALLAGTDPVQVAFSADSWTFDSVSADPVAGEPGPLDAVDSFSFDPENPTGPYTLTRPPYPGPRRVYLRAPGDLVPLSAGEVEWNKDDPTSFNVHPRTGRDLAGVDHLDVRYGIVAAGTQLKVMHTASVTLSATDPEKAEQALSLSLAVLALNRDALRTQGAFSFASGGYQAQGTLKRLAFSSGSTAAGVHTLLFSAEIDLLVQRLLASDEGKPIDRILSPGREAGPRKIDIWPAVEA